MRENFRNNKEIVKAQSCFMSARIWDGAAVKSVSDVGKHHTHSCTDVSVLRLLLSGDLIIFTVPFHSSYVRLPRYLGKILASGSTSEVWKVFINMFLKTCFAIMFSTLRGHDCIHVHSVNPKENLLLHGSHRPWVNSLYVRTQWISSDVLYCDSSWEGHKSSISLRCWVESWNIM